MRDWTVYPAIDLRGGRVVRLAQGDPQRETCYGDDPLAAARRWQSAGASWLHVVNLDGAFGDAATQQNADALLRIVALGCKVQFGGGLRTMADVRQAIDLGVERVVIGTAAVEEPALVAQLIQSYGPERVAVSIDARRGMVRTHGWRRGGGMSATRLARRCAVAGLRWLVYTDIARDGMGSGPDLDAAVRLANDTGLRVIAAGGVGSLQDASRSFAAGLSGVIIGRALYEGLVDLDAALQVGRTEDAG